MTTPRDAVAVVLCTRDRAQLLGGAVEAVLRSLRDGDELVVVDSASAEPTAVAPARSLGARIVRVDRPGLSRARNEGIRATTAPIVAFTDDDCRPDASWVETLARAFDAPGIGFVTGRADADRERRMSVSVMVGDTRRPIAIDANPFGIGVGANMAVRREALHEVGPFDERLGAGARLRAGEDVDMWWRLLHAGWDGVYEPAAAVTHVQWRNEVQTMRLAYGYGLGAGALAVKGMRAGRDGARALLARRLWDEGLRRALTDLRAGYQTGAAFSLVQTAGTVSGALQALRWRR